MKADLDLDEYDLTKVDRKTKPGESRNEAITRLLIEALDDAGGIAARQWVRERAEEYAAALVNSGHPDAGAWVDALTWFTRRIYGGRVEFLAHQEFAGRFGVDPYANDTSMKEVRPDT